MLTYARSINNIITASEDSGSTSNVTAMTSVGGFEKVCR